MKKLMRRAVMLSAVGSFLLGNGCVTQLQDAALDAGSTFVGQAVTELLNNFLSVDDLLGGSGD